MEDLNVLSSYSLAGAFGFYFVFLAIIAVLGIAVLIVTTISNWKIFKKAGLAGWEAIVPFYNTWCLVKIAGLEWWFFLIILSPVITAKFPILVLIAAAARFFANYNLAIKFEKDPVGFGIGLTLLPFVFYPILAFGKSTYVDKEVSPYGPIKKK